MRIYLRPVTLDDGPMIVKWRNSPNVSNHCFNKRPISEEINRKFYEDYVVTGKYKQFIVERVDEDFGISSYPIATIYLKDMDSANRRCELCLFTSNDQEWNTESQSIAVKMLVEKAFSEYNMHKIYSYVFNKFFDETSLLKKAGFEIEAILKDEAVNENGIFEDVVRLSLIRKDNEV